MKLYLCYCGFCFSTRKDFIEHLKKNKRWKNKHFAMDYQNLPNGFIIRLVRSK